MDSFIYMLLEKCFSTFFFFFDHHSPKESLETFFSDYWLNCGKF